MWTGREIKGGAAAVFLTPKVLQRILRFWNRDFFCGCGGFDNFINWYATYMVPCMQNHPLLSIFQLIFTPSAAVTAVQSEASAQFSNRPSACAQVMSTTCTLLCIWVLLFHCTALEKYHPKLSFDNFLSFLRSRTLTSTASRGLSQPAPPPSPPPPLPPPVLNSRACV